MRGWLAVAALGAAFLAPPAWGQRRGGAPGGFAGHAGFSARGSTGGRGSMMTNRSPSFGGVRGALHFRTGSARRFSSPFLFHHHRRFLRSWPYAGYYGYPYYNDPSYFGDDSYSEDSYQSYPTSGDSNRIGQSPQAEIDRLENEVGRLQGELDAREFHGSASEARPKVDSEPTQLVFRDKRTQEVQNYAIVGQTFWVFSEQRARKIPLADLDIPATKKANNDRGVEFQLPE